MKKTALAILVISMFAASSAMAASSTEMSINGFVNGMSQSSPGSSTSSTAEILGSFGYYFSPQFVGRLVLNEYANDTTTAGVTNSTGMMALGVGMKYYFSSPAKGSEVFYVFGDVSALAVSSTSTVNNVATTTTGSGSQVDVGIGVATFITEDVSFDLDIKSLSDSYTMSGVTISDSGAQFDFGITARF